MLTELSLILIAQTLSLGAWKTQLADEVSQTLALAGLGKLKYPPTLSPSLNAYRQAWYQKNPSIAPFLGHWQQDWELFRNYDLHVFPSTVPGQVCLIATQVSQPDPFEPPPDPPPQFSTLQIQGNAGQNQFFQLNQALLLDKEEGNNTWQFLGVLLNRPQFGQLRVYAATTPPQLASNLPADIQAKFRAHQCQ